MASEILIRELHQMREFAELVELQQAIWQMTPADCVSPHIMKAATLNGGVVIGAEHDGRLVGFCFGFAAKRGDNWMLWSFATGAHPDYQRQGIGHSLKQAQRAWARDKGYAQIGWTFDPLQRGNANFNFNRLGVIAPSYHVDFYGQMSDGINMGLASDRFEARWNILDDRSTELDGAQPVSGDDPRPVFLAQTDVRGALVQSRVPSWDAETYAVEIPYDLNALKQNDLNRAIQWQLIFRDAALQALAASYSVVGFVVQPPRCWYVLRRQRHEGAADT
jgi:predicted GNAT superfamily acetyltransferase